MTQGTESGGEEAEDRVFLSHTCWDGAVDPMQDSHTSKHRTEKEGRGTGGTMGSPGDGNNVRNRSVAGRACTFLLKRHSRSQEILLLSLLKTLFLKTQTISSKPCSKCLGSQTLKHILF